MANGTADREVSLVIKAKNEASKAIEGVSDALRVLTNGTAEAAQGAAKADSLLAELGQSFEALQRQAQGLQALGVVAKAFDKAGESVARLESQAKAAGESAGSIGQRFADQAARADQLREAYRRQRDELVALLEQSKKPGGEGTQQQSAINAAKERYRAVGLAIREAEKNQGALAEQVSSANDAFTRSQATLTKARTELAEIGEIARAASAALGGVALSQQAIAAASKTTAENLSRVRSALDREAESGRPLKSPQAGAPAASATAAYRAQIQAVRDAEAAYNATRESASRLGAQMAATVQPTEAMRAEFLVSRQAAAQSKLEYLNQAEALNRLRGVTQGSFSTFLQNAAAMDADARASRSDAESKQTLAGAWHALVEAARGARASMEEASSTVSEHGGVLKRVKDEAIGLVAAYGGVIAVIDQAKAAIDTFREIENAKARLTVVFEGNGQAVGRELEFIYRTADRLGLSFKELSEEYTKVAIGAKEAGYSTEGTRKIFLAFAEAGRVAGFSTQDVQSAFLGLKESIERGTINARNFDIEIGQRIPGAVQAMAAAAGVSVQKFKEMEKSGHNLAATEDLLVRFADNIRNRLAGGLEVATKSLNAEIGRFETNLQRAQLTVANGGFAAALQRALSELNVFFESDSGRRFFLEIGAALGRLVNLVRLAAENFDKLLLILKAYLAIRFALFVTGLIAQFGTLSAAVTALAARFALMWEALIGPAGAVVAVITFVASLFAGKLFTGVDIATSALAKHADIMSKVQGAYEDAGGKVDDYRRKLDGLTQTELLAQRADLEKGRSEVVNSVNTNILRGPLRDQFGHGGEYLTAFRGAENVLNPLIQKFRQGQLSVQDFNKRLDEIRPALAKIVGSEEIATNIVKGFQESASKAGDLATKSHEVDLVIRSLSPDAKVAAAALAELNKSAADSGKAFATAPLELYLKALRDIQKELPEFARTVAAQEKIASIRDSARTELTALRAQVKDPAVGAQIDSFLGRLSPNGTVNPEQRAQQFMATVEDAIRHVSGSAALDDHLNGDRGEALLATANRYRGLNENNQRDRLSLETLFRQANINLDPKQTAWCAAFVSAVLASNNLPIPSRNPTAARSFLDYGTEVSADKAQPGDIVILKGAAGPASGHVGFFQSLNANGSVNVLGGNQSDQVKVSTFRPDQVLPGGIRRAPTASEAARTQEAGDTAVDETARFFTDLERKLIAEAEAIGKSPRDAFIESKVQEAIQKAENAKQGLQPAQREELGAALTFALPSIKDAAAKSFDAKKEQEDQQKLAGLIDEVDNKTRKLTRDQFILNEAKRQGIDLSTATGKAYGDELGKKFDLQQNEQSYNDVLGLSGQRKTLIGELQSAFKEGDNNKVQELSRQIDEITAKLKAAYPAAMAFAEAIGDRDKIAGLEKVKAGLEKVKPELITFQEVNQQLATGGTNALIKMAEAAGRFLSGFGKIKDVLKASGLAIAQFASDFLRYLAEMVIKYELLQLLLKSPLGGYISKVANGIATGQQLAAAAAFQASGTTLTGAGAVLTGAAGLWDATAAAIQVAADTLLAANAASGAGLFHAGGIAGSAGGMRRSVSPAIFAGALRYHVGGIAGLKPGEIPAVLKRGEEILTEDNPRHIINQARGGGGSSGQSSHSPVKIVNAFDPATVLEQSLATEVGQKVILNHVRNNRNAWSTALGVR